MEENKISKKWIKGIVLFIGIFIIVDFIMSNPHYSIDIETIICFSLMSILILSDYFDVLNIPHIISLKKENNELKKENTILKEQNIKIMTSNTNIQNINIPSGPFSSQGTKNIDDAINDEDSEEIEGKIDEKTDCKRANYDELNKLRRNIPKVAIQKITESDKIKQNNVEVLYDFHITNFKNDIINKNEIAFDAAIRGNNEYTFYDIVKSNNTIMRKMIKNDLELKLQMIKNYGEALKYDSKLVLGILKYNDDMSDIIPAYFNERSEMLVKYLEDTFEPAIKKNIFEIRIINICKEDIINNEKNDRK